MTVPGSDQLIVAGDLANIHLVDLKLALAQSELDPTDALLLAEIDAGAEVHAGGGLTILTSVEWLSKWREFQRRFPEFH